MRKRIVSPVGLIVALALLLSSRTAIATGVNAPAFAGWETTATLTGAEEVPDPGDPDGSGNATVRLGASASEVCFDIQVSGITLPAAAAHIHRGARGVAGPIVVPLTAPDANGTASGCTNADAAILAAIHTNPAEFYVNVHTTDFPGGAVRGQLALAEGSGGPATTMPATGETGRNLPLLGGLALVVLLVGLGLNWRARRRTNTQ